MSRNQTSITYNKSFDNLVNVMAQIGRSLPAFQEYTELFQGNKSIQQVLCLFYQDILDLYFTFLEFFRHTDNSSMLLTIASCVIIGDSVK